MATEMTCHASRCERLPTTRLRVKNNGSFKEQATSGIDYCDEHAEMVGWRMSDRGLLVFLEPLQREGA